MRDLSTLLVQVEGHRWAVLLLYRDQTWSTGEPLLALYHSYSSDHVRKYSAERLP